MGKKKHFKFLLSMFLMVAVPFSTLVKSTLLKVDDSSSIVVNKEDKKENSSATSAVTLGAYDSNNEHDHDTDNYIGLSQDDFSSGVSLVGGNSYYLLENTNLPSNISIESGIVILCLNGKILRGSEDDTSNAVISVTNNRTLKLYDCKYNDEAGSSHNYYIQDDYKYKICDDDCSSIDHEHEADKIVGGVITGGQNGGVYVLGIDEIRSYFYMYGGTIVGNYGSTTGEGIGQAGVSIRSGEFYMYGGAIKGNVQTGTYIGGGGVIVGTGAFHMYSGEVSYNYSLYGGGMTVGNQDNHGGTRTSTLVLYDGAKVINNIASIAGGGLYAYNEVDITMEDGSTIANNTVLTDGSTQGYGGGVYLENESTFNVEGGEIYGNSADYGGGVYVSNVGKNNSFNISGGSVYENTATYGGGAYVIGSKSETNFSMTGGYIQENKADYGAGLYLDDKTNNSTIHFQMTAGSVTKNVATTAGAGVYVNSSTTALSIYGSIQIDENYLVDNAESNLDISAGSLITISGTLTSAWLGITFSGDNTQITTGFWGSGNRGYFDLQRSYFFSDNGRAICIYMDDKVDIDYYEVYMAIEHRPDGFSNDDTYHKYFCDYLCDGDDTPGIFEKHTVGYKDATEDDVEAGEDPSEYHVAYCTYSYCSYVLSVIKHEYGSHSSVAHYYECVCGVGYTEDHTFNENEYFDISEGYHYQQCSVCLEVVGTEHSYIKLNDHDEECEVCGTRKSTDHEYVADVTDPHKYVCSTCKDSYSTDCDYGSPIEEFGNLEQHYVECSVCSDKQYYDHNYTYRTIDAHKSQCECGSIQTTEHNFTGASYQIDSAGAGSHYQVCTYDGCDVRSYSEHNYQQDTSNLHYYQCNECNDYYQTDCDYGSPIEESGNLEQHYVECSVCSDKQYYDHNYTYRTIDAHNSQCECGSIQTTNHDYTDAEYKYDSATGIHYQECNICKNEQKLYTKHNYVVDSVDSHKYECSDCKNSYTTEHTYVGATYYINNETNHYQVCTTCNSETLYSDHQFSSWAATAEVGYDQERTCIYCSYKEYQTVLSDDSIDTDPSDPSSSDDSTEGDLKDSDTPEDTTHSVPSDSSTTDDPTDEDPTDNSNTSDSEDSSSTATLLIATSSVAGASALLSISAVIKAIVDSKKDNKRA